MAGVQPSTSAISVYDLLPQLLKPVLCLL